MTEFIEHTIDDLSHGRQTWRIYASLSILSLALGAALPFIH
jgi:hypothetical protein